MSGFDKFYVDRYGTVINNAAIYSGGELHSGTGQAISTGGRNYTELPNAFAFRKAFNASCSCRAPVQTWSQALKHLEDDTLEQGDIGDAERLKEAFAKHRPRGVVHLAGYIEVGESVKLPERYIHNNATKTDVLIAESVRQGIGAFVLTAGSLMQTDQLLAGVVMLSLLGLLIAWGLGMLERAWLKWR